MLVEIKNMGESNAFIIKEMSEEQFNFLVNVAEELNNSRAFWAPVLGIQRH